MDQVICPFCEGDGCHKCIGRGVCPRCGAEFDREKLCCTACICGHDELGATLMQAWMSSENALAEVRQSVIVGPFEQSFCHTQAVHHAAKGEDYPDPEGLIASAKNEALERAIRYRDNCRWMFETFGKSDPVFKERTKRIVG